MIKILCHYGADITIKDREGLTPIDMLYIEPSEIKSVLLSFHIEPNRDKDFCVETCIRTGQDKHLHTQSKTKDSSIYHACAHAREALICENPRAEDMVVFNPMSF
jgi:hypothetical protein